MADAETKKAADPNPAATAAGGESGGRDPAMGNGNKDGSKHPARIQVSLGKKPLFFYVNLAKRLLAQHGEVQLSALGFAMSNMVSVAEILKKEKLATEVKLTTAIDILSGQGRPRPVRKPKMEIVMRKSDQFDAIMAKERVESEKAAAAAGKGEESGAAAEDATPAAQN